MDPKELNEEIKDEIKALQHNIAFRHNISLGEAGKLIDKVIKEIAKESK